MADKSQFIVALITVPNEEVGLIIARALIAQKLAACVNILPGVRSIYSWEGQTADEKEILLLVKTRADVFQDRLVPEVRALHPYETPEIIALPILLGTEDYLGWMGEAVTREA